MAKKPSQKPSSASGSGKTSGRTRHSKTAKKPVTIDHDATETKKSQTSKPASARRSVPVSKPAPGKTKATAASSGEKAVSKPEPVKPVSAETGASNTAAKSSASASSSAKDTVKSSSSSQDTGKKGTQSAAAAQTGQAKPAAAEASSSSAQARPSASATPRKDEKSGSWGSSLIAACIGGIVALGLAGLLQYAGILSTPGAPANDAQATAQLQDRIAGLEERLQSGGTGVTGEDVSKLIDEKLAGAEPPADTRVNELAARVSQMQDRLESLPAATSMNSSIAAQVAELSEQVADLKSGGASASGASSRQDDGSAARIDEMSQSISALERDLSGRIGTVSKTVADISAQQDDIMAQVAQTSAKLDDISAKTQQTNADITALRDHVENGADRRAAAAIAAAALKSDIDSGAPFSESLENLKAFASQGENLQSLETFAQTGVPTVSQLNAEFENSVSDAILAATTEPEDDSLASRLAAGARSLVEVKPLGAVEGETPEARVSQIAQALKNGDLSKASQVWSALPEAGRDASQAWHQRLQARLTANTVVTGTVETILKSSRGG